MFIKFKFDSKTLFGNLKNNIFTKVNKSLDKTYMVKVGNILADDIARRTRLGFGVKKSGQLRQKLKPLTPKYKDFRKKNKRKLYSLTTPKKSNLTFTGQLLNSLKARSEGIGRVTVFFKGTHKNLDGSKMPNGLLANYVSKKRPFLGPSNREIQRLKTNIKNRILKSL